MSTKKVINKNHIRLVLCGLLITLTPSAAFAYGSGQDVLSNVLSNLVALLSSTPARILMAIAVIGIGYGTLYLGKLPKGKAIASVIGIGLIFGSSYIMNKLLNGV